MRRGALLRSSNLHRPVEGGRRSIVMLLWNGSIESSSNLEREATVLHWALRAKIKDFIKVADVLMQAKRHFYPHLQLVPIELLNDLDQNAASKDIVRHLRTTRDFHRQRTMLKTIFPLWNQ